MKRLCPLLGVIAMVAVAGCGGSDAVAPTGTPGTYFGPTLAMGNGTIRSYITYGANGQPTEVGATLTEAALTGLPTAQKTLFEVMLPAEAAVTPFNHIEFRYWPNGHDPDGLFDKQHFDVIPFMMTPAERDTITATGADYARVVKVPSIEDIPIGYAQIPDVDQFFAEPRYGTRYFDVAGFTPVLNHQQPYTTTLFYGLYDGKVNFFEIPVTFALLEAQGNTTYAFPLPKSVPKPGYYPTRYRVKYDATTKEYTFAMEGLEYR